MFSGKRIGSRTWQRSMRVFFLALSPALVVLGCGAESPETELAVGSCEGDDCSVDAVLDEALGVELDAESSSPDGTVEKLIYRAIDPNFPGNCTSAQLNTAGGDEAQALRFVNDIISKRANLISANPSANTRTLFQAQFNASSVAERTFVLDSYQKIKNAFADTEIQCQKDAIAGDSSPRLQCTLNGRTGACCIDIFPGANAITLEPKKIIFCAQYFENTNRPSRAKTLIHEVSHQQRTGDAVDTGALFNGVATPFPNIHNASSYQGFADKCTSPSTCI